MAGRSYDSPEDYIRRLMEAITITESILVEPIGQSLT